MRSSRLAWTLSVLIVVMAVPAMAAHVEQGTTGEDGPAPTRPHRPVPVPPKPQDAELTAYVGLLDVAAPIQHRGLAIYPLTAGSVRNDRGYESLDAALQAGHLEVTETDTVSVLKVRNRSGQFVFIMAGEILTGGKQDRTARQDVLLAPHTGPIQIPVYCVEKGRWSGRIAKFGSGGQMGHMGLRAKAAAGASQDEVWRDVARKSRELGVSAPTGKLAQVVDSAEVKKRRRELTAACRNRFPANTVGIVLCRYGRIVGADAFASPALFRSLKHKLISSFALDIMPSHRRLHRPPWPGKERVRQFVRTVLQARHLKEATPGSGYRIRIGHGSTTGTAQMDTTGLVHVQLFSRRPIVRPPLPVPLPRPRQEEQDE